MCICKMPFSDTYLNILDLCRLCLVKDSILTPVFDSSLNGHPLSDKINTCLAIQIKTEDRVSQKICNECLTKVNSFYEFHINTSETQKVLQRWLSESSEKALNSKITEDTETPRKDTDGEVKEELKSEQSTSEETNDSDNDCETRSDCESSNSEESDGSVTSKEEKNLNSNIQTTVFNSISQESEVPGPSGIHLESPQLSSTKLQEPSRHKIKNSVEEKCNIHCLTKTKIINTSMDKGDQGLNINHYENDYHQIQFVTPDVTNETVLNVCDDENTSKQSKEKSKKKFECTLCHFTAKYKSQLDIHVKRHQKDYKIFCDICHKGFFYKNEIEMHKALHEETNRFQCNVCHKKFVYRHSLVSHARKHQNMPKSQKSYQCDKCGKEFSDKSYLKRHIEVHTGVNRVICEICGQLLSNPGALRSHTLTHTGERPFPCNTCGKAFTTKKYMMIHKRMHTGVKPFICQICGKSFSQQSTLIVHKRYHSGEKPYPCQVCNKAFVTKTILKIHQKNHTL